MPVNRRSGLLLCLGALLLLGCGGTQDGNLAAPDHPQDEIDQSQLFARRVDRVLNRLESGKKLPGLPADPQSSRAEILARRGSVVGETPLLGFSAVDVPGYFWDEDNPYIHLDPRQQELTLTPPAGELSWGLYRFENLLPEDNPNQITVDISGRLPARYYVALADYDSRRWQWLSVDDSQGRDVLPLASADGTPIQPLSADGSLYVVVASSDEVEVTISRLLLGLDSPAPPPAGLKVEQVDGIATFKISWTEPDFPYDAIQLERRGNASSGGPSDFVEVPAGQSELVEQPLNVHAAPIVDPGKRIGYRLRTVVNGRAGPPGPIVECWRVPEPLADLVASSDLPFDIRLNWEPGGNSHIEIYRDSPDNLVHTVSFSGSSYLEQLVPDYEDHQYWIRGYLKMDSASPGLRYYTNTLGPVSGTRLKAPYITWVQPTPAQSGQSVSFTPVVYGQPPLSYSWDFNGATTPDMSTEIEPTVTAGAAGFTRCSLSVTNAHGSDGHDFDLLVTDGPRPWMQFKYDQGNSGRVPFPGAIVGEEIWNFPSGATIYGCVVFGLDGTIYFGNEAGNFYALNPDGSEKWVLPLGYKIEAPALVAPSGDIYVASDELYCIDPAGTLKWQNPAGGGGYHQPPNLRPDGNVLAEGAVISPAGELLWQYNDNGQWGGGLAMQADGTAFTGGDVIYCFGADGYELWDYELGTNESVPALRPDGSFVIGSYWNGLSCIGPDSELIWNYNEPDTSSIYSSPAVDTDGTVVLGSYTEVIALNPDGSEKWTYPDPVSIWAGPTIDSAGHVYFVSYDGGVVYCVNIADGSPVWQHAVGDYVTTEPAIGLDGTVYVANRAGKLFAIGDAP